MNSILLVEDDENLGASLEAHLKTNRYGVWWAKSIEQAKSIFTTKEVNLIILDWTLPDGQGVDWIKTIRNDKPTVPVIMLTARTELIDKILGLETGADDYMTKPFEVRELMARIRVQLRTHPIESTLRTYIKLGGLTINLETREVQWKSQLRELTKMEYELLRLLADAPNRVFSREEILNKVWGYENYPSTRTVDTHILQLRQKFTDTLIETIRGIGYRLRHTSNRNI